MLFLFALYFANKSAWWLLICLAAGILYASFLYSHTGQLSKAWRFLLYGLRVFVIFLITALLLSPLIKLKNYRVEKPLVLILQDNSSSLARYFNNKPDRQLYKKQLAQLKQDLGSDYNVHEFHFSNELLPGLNFSFDGRQTAFSNVLADLSNRFANQNVGALIVASDGIYNFGSSPLYQTEKFKAPVYTIALGDTIPQRDLKIAHINYNRVVSLGNEFLFEIFVEGYKVQGESTRLRVLEDGRELFSEELKITSPDYRKTFTVKLKAEKKGMHKYGVSLQALDQEVSLENNQESVYVDVQDQQKKILILYASPHPDIAALRHSLDTHANFHAQAASVADFKVSSLKEYNLVIFHQLPTKEKRLNEITAELNRLKIAAWYITGAQSAMNEINATQDIFTFDARGTGMQEVFAVAVSGFTLFTLSDSSRQKIESLPPLLSNSGSYNSDGAVLLTQKIGQTATANPLLIFRENAGQRKAVLAAEGLWKWRFAEFEKYENHHAFDELVNQSAQYLTANNSGKRFIIQAPKNIYNENEHIVFTGELYNDARELINIPDVRIDFKNDSGRVFNYMLTRKDKAYVLDLEGLPAGEYFYKASTNFENKDYEESGQIAVKVLDIENRFTVADHHLLYAMAENTGGLMVQPDEIIGLYKKIRDNDNVKTIVYEDVNFREMIDVKWIFLIIIIFISAEWFFRKRNGAI
jgi:hypothetical protein